MRSDEQLEGLLEEWLDDEARSMPHEVLESVLEAVPRTAQSGRPALLARWRVGGRGFALALAAGVIVLAVLVAPLVIERGRALWFAIGGGTEAERWEAAVEFRHAPNQLNPSPDRYGNPAVWSYLRSSTSAHDPTTYVPLPTFSSDTWNDPGLVNLFVGGWAEEPEGFLVLHPWSDGPALRRNAILGWTSPVSGLISIHGSVGRAQPSCPVSTGKVTFSIDRGSTSLKSIDLLLGQSADFDYSTTIAAGESIYFIVDAGPDASCDLTYLGALHIFHPPLPDSTLSPI